MDSDSLPLAVRQHESPRWRSQLIFTVCVATLAIGGCVAMITVGAAAFGLWVQSGSFYPERIPPRVQYLGEDYSCMGLPAPDTLAGLTQQGRTVGGGLIYARPPIDSHASEGWIVVTDGHRRQACIYNGRD